MARGEKGRGGLEHLKFRELGEISEGSIGGGAVGASLERAFARSLVYARLRNGALMTDVIISQKRRTLLAHLQRNAGQTCVAEVSAPNLTTSKLSRADKAFAPPPLHPLPSFRANVWQLFLLEL